MSALVIAAFNVAAATGAEKGAGGGVGAHNPEQQQKHKPMFTVDIMALFTVLGAGKREGRRGDESRKGSGGIMGGEFKNRGNGREGRKKE